MQPLNWLCYSLAAIKKDLQNRVAKADAKCNKNAAAIMELEFKIRLIDCQALATRM